MDPLLLAARDVLRLVSETLRKSQLGQKLAGPLPLQACGMTRRTASQHHIFERAEGGQQVEALEHVPMCSARKRSRRASDRATTVSSTSIVPADGSTMPAIS